MGGYQTDIPIPHSKVMSSNVELQGQWMCTREDIEVTTKMVDRNALRLGGILAPKGFPLEGWKEAFEFASESRKPTTFIP